MRKYQIHLKVLNALFFAIQAGREVRIMVKADKVSDDDTILMAKDIVKRIEEKQWNIRVR